jgi:hypothetical protein
VGCTGQARLNATGVIVTCAALDRCERGCSIKSQLFIEDGCDMNDMMTRFLRLSFPPTKILGSSPVFFPSF